MRNEQLFINDDCFTFLSEDELISSLTKLVDFFRDTLDHKIPAVLTTSYWDLSLPSGMLMYQLLYDENFPLEVPRDLRTELMKYLDRCEFCETAPVNVTISCHGFNRNYFSGSFALARARLESNKIFPMFFDFSSEILGKRTYFIEQALVSCFFIANSEQISSYYRCLLEHVSPRGKDFIRLAQLAYPKLKFHTELDLDDLGIDLNLHFPTVMHHLSFLNDEYAALGSAVKWDLPRLMQEARARGVEFSDESANTKRDIKKMKHRDIAFQGKSEIHVMSCSLHTKILPTEGRIHFHSPHSDSDNCVLIGIFHKHLPV